MRHANGTIIPETVLAASDSFALMTGTGSAQTLSAFTRAIYFPAAAAAVTAVTGAGTSVGPFAATAGLVLPIATNKITVTSGVAYVVLY